MHRVGYELNCQSIKTESHGDFYQEFFQPRLERPNQNLVTMARVPNQMVVDTICAVWAVAGCVWHRPILEKEGGFLHSLKRGGFCRQEL